MEAVGAQTWAGRGRQLMAGPIVQCATWVRAERQITGRRAGNQCPAWLGINTSKRSVFLHIRHPTLD